MEDPLFGNLQTEDILLLFDLSSLKKPFLLNEVYNDFKQIGETKLSFFLRFFALQTNQCIRVEKMPREYVKGPTNIVYSITSSGRAVIQHFIEMNKELLSSGT